MISKDIRRQSVEVNEAKPVDFFLLKDVRLKLSLLKLSPMLSQTDSFLPLAMVSGGKGSSSTWAEVMAMIHRKTDYFPIQDGPVLEKLKENTTDFVQIDMEAQSRA